MTSFILRRAWPLAGAVLTASLVCSACTVDNNSGGGSNGQKLTVSSTDNACEVSADHAAAGTLTFAVTNKGSKVTEFYLLDRDGKRVVGEVENIGPGLTRKLVVQAQAGNYLTACKPGMEGKGLRAPFTVTGGASASNTADDVAVRKATGAGRRTRPSR